MSNYRDDSISTAIVSDTSWTNTSALLTELATFTISTMFGLMVMSADTAFASDETQLGGRGLMVVETAEVLDGVSLSRQSSLNYSDQIKATDHYFFNFQCSIEDYAIASDYDLGCARFNHFESARASGLDLSQRIVTTLVVENGRVSDYSFAAQQEQTIENLVASDNIWLQNNTRILTFETAIATDFDLSLITTDFITIESAQLVDSTWGKLDAVDLSVSYAAIEDTVLGNIIHGQAWTAHADNMAMSRYAPFNFEGMSVIDGQLYAWSDQGVYFIGDGDEQIEARLSTGKIDFGESLTHPTASYLEYELSGIEKQIDIDVVTTQSGQAKTYNYVMPLERADNLTNGRIIFGRGLRGRHFSFNLNIKGTSAYIHSLSFDHTKTARRI